MSRTVRRSRDASTTDDQDRDDATDGIPLGSYREDRRVVSATYHPERDVVRIEDSASRTTTTVSRGTWLAWSHGQAIDRVARQRRELVRDGELLDHPECADAGCPCRLTTLEVERSEDAGLSDAPRCRTCLPEYIDEFPPWVSPEDRTVDRSAVRAVQETSLPASGRDRDA